MTHEDLEHFHGLLLERKQNLSEWLESPSWASESDIRKARELLASIGEALGRVSHGSYGACAVCHDPVERQRLEVQPVTQVCLGCITKEEQAQLEYDLYLAGKMHRALLPRDVAHIDGFEIAVRSLAARIVGGDYYDFLPVLDRQLGRAVIADAMGKGIPAGLLMSNIQGALRIMAEEIVSPAVLVARLNRWLCRNLPITKFVTLACIDIERSEDGRICLVTANAGHCPPLILHSDGQVECINPTGSVIGVHDGFEFGEDKRELHSGDLLVLYTDGVTEIEDAAGEMFGEERFVQTLVESRNNPTDSILDRVLAEVRSFSRKEELSDDCTMIALRLQ